MNLNVIGTSFGGNGGTLKKGFEMMRYSRCFVIKSFERCDTWMVMRRLRNLVLVAVRKRK